MMSQDSLMEESERRLLGLELFISSSNVSTFYLDTIAYDHVLSPS